MAETYPNWVNLTLTDVRKWVSDTLVSFESMLPKLYTMGTSDKQEEYDVTYSGLGKFKLVTGTVGKDSMAEEHKTTYTFAEWMNELDVQRRLYDDKQDRQVMILSRELALSAKRSRESHGAEPFNNAFTATGTFSDGTSTAHADGKALCATNHSSKANAGYAGVNKGTTVISPASVMSARDMMRNFTDGRGNKQYCELDMLLGPAHKDFEEVAWEIINTTGKVDVADNNRNFHQGRYKLALWGELTNSKNHFYIDSSKMSLYLHWLDRIALEFYDSYTPNPPMFTYGGYMRYGFNANNWRWIVGHEVA